MAKTTRKSATTSIAAGRARTMDEIPDAPRYLCGYDLYLSGWGAFGSHDTPTRAHGMDFKEYATSDVHRRCPVVYPVPDGVPDDVLWLNCRVSDIAGLEYLRRGKPRTTPTPEFKSGLAADLQPFKHSIVGAFMAMAAFDEFSATQLHHRLDWWIRVHRIPFVVVRTHHARSRWFHEPGLGHTHHDADGVPYRFRHPAERFRKGDHALVDGRVRPQNYQYRGRGFRPKVELA